MVYHRVLGVTTFCVSTVKVIWRKFAKIPHLLFFTFKGRVFIIFWKLTVACAFLILIFVLRQTLPRDANLEEKELGQHRIDLLERRMKQTNKNSNSLTNPENITLSIVHRLSPPRMKYVHSDLLCSVPGIRCSGPIELLKLRNGPKKSASALSNLTQFYSNFTSDINVEYPEFFIKAPRFLTEEEQKLFLKNPMYQKALVQRPDSQRRGVISLIKQGIAVDNIGCGFRSDLDDFRQISAVPRNTRMFQVACPLLVPGGNSFQHFLDGVLPKIVQVLPLLQSSSLDIKVLLPIHPRDRIITEMLARLGIPPSQVVWVGMGEIIIANCMINVCVTPPIHPILWQSARTLLGAPVEPDMPAHGSNVVLLTRSQSHNGGRRILNRHEVAAFLHNRYKERFVQFRGKPSLTEAVSLFGNAGLVIGVHGGAFYNIQFCPRGTHVIEIMPEDRSGNPPRHLSYNIFWVMASMLDHTYWRMALLKSNQNNDVDIPLDKLKQLLDNVDNGDKTT